MKYTRTHYVIKCWYNEQVWFYRCATYKDCLKFLEGLQKEEIPDKIEIREQCILYDPQ